MDSFDSQFSRSLDYWLKGLDFPTWYRYLCLIRELISGTSMPESILEIGVGSRIVENILRDKVNRYVTLDINPALEPNIVGDLRTFNTQLSGEFDCIICADVLEHMPSEDLKRSLKNIFGYLNENGKTLITIPHRRREVMIISRFARYRIHFISLPIWITPIGFYRRFIKKKINIDQNHLWEIGDIKVNRNDVENTMKNVGFQIVKFNELPYTDFWVLKKVGA